MRVILEDRKGFRKELDHRQAQEALEHRAVLVRDNPPPTPGAPLAELVYTNLLFKLFSINSIERVAIFREA